MASFPAAWKRRRIVSMQTARRLYKLRSETRLYTTERNHPLFKVPYTGKVLVYPSPRGSGGFMSYGSGAKPAAFVHTEGSPLSVACAMVGRIPSMTDFETDPLDVIETGDLVLVNADEGYIEITKKD